MKTSLASMISDKNITVLGKVPDYTEIVIIKEATKGEIDLADISLLRSILLGGKSESEVLTTEFLSPFIVDESTLLSTDTVEDRSCHLNITDLVRAKKALEGVELSNKYVRVNNVIYSHSKLFYDYYDYIIENGLAQSAE